MANVGFLQKSMGYFPFIEMVVRRIYNYKFLNKFLSKNNFRKNIVKSEKVEFTEIINHLKAIGIKHGDIVIVHSAFKTLKNSGLSPDEIINELLDLVGENGTIVMPVIRKYQYQNNGEPLRDSDLVHDNYIYDVRNTEVWTGALAKVFMNRKEAVISNFPLNTIAAIGWEANKMIEKELNEELPTANGPNSAWKYCADKNAWIISLGTDLTHSLTMIHTAEDCLGMNWPINNWYRKVRFKIINEYTEIEKIVLERRPSWGRLHFGERKLCADLIKDKILMSNHINGVLVESVRSKVLINYLNSKNHLGYPYFWLGKNLKRR